MDCVFDRTAEGRVIKCLTIVDDATHESVAIEVERAISGHGVSRVLDRLAPVSYTHLDVYKRQAYVHDSIRKIFLTFPARLRGSVICTSP